MPFWTAVTAKVWRRTCGVRLSRAVSLNRPAISPTRTPTKTATIIAKKVNSSVAAPFTAMMSRTGRRSVIVVSNALPAGSYVAPAFPLVHSDVRRYPHPDEFRPDRFLGGAVAPDAWIPFGGGKRRCVGSHLAMLELRTVVAEVVRRLDLRPASPAPERPRLHHVTMVPADGAMVIARRRTAPAPSARPRSAAPRERTEGGRTRAPTPAPPPARAPGA